MSANPSIPLPVSRRGRWEGFFGTNFYRKLLLLLPHPNKHAVGWVSFFPFLSRFLETELVCIGRRIAGRISLAVFFHRLQHFTHRLPTTPASSQFCNTTFHRPSSLAPSICTFGPAPYPKGPVLLFASSGGNKILLLLLNALPLRVSVFHGVFLEHQMCWARSGKDNYRERAPVHWPEQLLWKTATKCKCMFPLVSAIPPFRSRAHSARAPLVLPSHRKAVKNHCNLKRSLCFPSPSKVCLHWGEPCSQLQATRFSDKHTNPLNLLQR